VQRCETGSLAETKTVKASSDHTVVLTLCFSFPKINASLDFDEALELFENKQRLAYSGGTKYPPKGFTIDTDGLHDVSILYFREAYPQFRDLTDRQIADRWHQKFYKSMSLDDFEKKIKLGSSSLADPTTAKPIEYEKLAAMYGGIVIESAQKRLDSFKIPQSDFKYIDNQARLGLLNAIGSILLQLLGTLIGFWIFVVITGWIARGFMGISRGQDSKPNTPEEAK
jgi:hypothetical protein